MAKKRTKPPKKGRKPGPKEERLVIPPEHLGATIDRMLSAPKRRKP